MTDEEKEFHSLTRMEQLRIAEQHIKHLQEQLDAQPKPATVITNTEAYEDGTITMNQPKPASGDRGKDGIYNAANGILQSLNKPAGEWTGEYVAKFLIVHSDWQQQIADAHNAQIEAVYRKGYEDGRSDKNTTE